MAMSDPIADFLTRLRNGRDAKHRYVDVPVTKMNRSLAEVLQNNGYVDHVLVNDEKRKMRVFLRYSKQTKQAVMQGLKRVSRPGQRRYVSHANIPYVYSGLGQSILSTPIGVVDGKTAKLKNVGGEVLAYVW